MPGAGGLVGEAAESPHPVGNGKWKAATNVRWVGTAGKQQLADLAWLLIQIRLNESIAINPDVDVKEVDGPRVDVVVKGELDGRMEVVAVLDELFQLLLLQMKKMSSINLCHKCTAAPTQAACQFPVPISAIDLEPNRLPVISIFSYLLKI